MHASRHRRPARAGGRRAGRAARRPVGLGEILVPHRARVAGDGLAGVRDGSVLVGVGAAPEDSAANVAVCRAIADAVGVPRSRVSIVRGEADEDKTVRVDDVPDEAAAFRALGLEPPADAGRA